MSLYAMCRNAQLFEDRGFLSWIILFLCVGLWSRTHNKSWEYLINLRFQFFNMRNYLNLASMVLFPAAKVSFNFLLQATDNYFPSLDRIKFKAAGCLSFLCLPLGVFSFHCYKLKMVVGLFVYQHLFGSRETKFLINLLRTHPRFPAATWPLVLPQVLRYPLGRDYSVTPPLPVERGNYWVAAAPPAVKRARGARTTRRGL